MVSEVNLHTQYTEVQRGIYRLTSRNRHIDKHTNIDKQTLTDGHTYNLRQTETTHKQTEIDTNKQTQSNTRTAID